MDTTIDQQMAMDEALVPDAKRLWIGRSNFRLLSDIKSKESTLKLVYDVLRLSPFFKAFLVTAYVSEIYMQEFWAIATVHHHSIWFMMDNKKHIINLESFREMLHICPRLAHQPFVEPPFEEEILAFLWFLRHSGAIRRLTNVEHKDIKKRNKMYYPRSMNVIVRHFMSKDPSIPRRNKQQFGALLPIELTNEDIRNSNAYKEYYAVATGVTLPKPKASVWKTRSSSDITITPPTAAADEGTGSILRVPNIPTDESEEELSWNSTDEEGDDDEGKDGDDDDGDDGEEGDDDDQEVERDDEKDDKKEGGDDEQDSDKEEFIHHSLSTHAEDEPRDEESFDPIPRTPENSDDEGNGEEDLGLNVGREEGRDEEEEEDELYRDININQGKGIQTTQEIENSHVTLTPVNPDGMESIFETTSQMDMQTPTPVAPLPMSAPTITPSTIATITITQQAPLPPTTAPSTLLQDIPNFGLLFGFDHRLKTLEANFSEFMQTNQFARASNQLREEAQAKNDEFLKTIDENMQKIIKEQVKEQVKVQVSKILPKIEQTVNEQLEAEVLTRSSHSSKTSYAVAADLSEMELKKILIKKMEGNKRCDDDADKDEKPSIGPDRGSKRSREGKEPESASTPTETATRSAGKSTQGSKSRQMSASESATVEKPMQTTFQMEEPSHLEFDTCAKDQPIVQSSQHPEWFSQRQKPPTPDRDWNKTLPATHGSIQPWISELAKQSDTHSSFNRLKVDTLTPELLSGPTYELLKGSCKSLVELEYHLEEVYKDTTDQLDWVNPKGQQYPHNLLKPLTLIPNNRGHRVIPFDHFINNDLEYLHGGRKRQQFYRFAINRESSRDVYSKRRIIAVNEIKIVEWHNYKNLDWIMVRRDDDKLYKFKEGDFKRLRIQDIEDMLLLLVQEKLANLTVEERFAFNVSIRMFTKSIVIQRRVEDLQLGVKSYQKKLNLTKPDTYCSDLKRKEAYVAYFNPRGFIYQNKDKKNRDYDAISAHSIWRKSDKDRAATMIQAIDKRLKTRRIMRSLERFVRGRLYEGDFKMLQRTI
nr:hypothetical protein [Tanacetum cinerariifolium]